MAFTLPPRLQHSLNTHTHTLTDTRSCRAGSAWALFSSTSTPLIISVTLSPHPGPSRVCDRARNTLREWWWHTDSAAWASTRGQSIHASPFSPAHPSRHFLTGSNLALNHGEQGNMRWWGVVKGAATGFSEGDRKSEECVTRKVGKCKWMLLIKDDFDGKS